MGAIQVKNVPADVHDALRRRASEEGIDLQDYVMRLIRRDLSLPSQREWLDELRAQPVVRGTPSAADELRQLRRERADRR